MNNNFTMNINKHNVGKMLFLILIFLIVGFLGFYLVISSSILNKSNWNTYVNSRFEYSIKYPKNWTKGRVATNGDGVSLYKDKNGDEVLVYASNVSFGFSSQGNHLLRDIFILDDGTKATILKLKPQDKMLLLIIVTKDNGQQFVLSASGTDKFINDNEELLREIGKTLQIADKEIDEKN